MQYQQYKLQGLNLNLSKDDQVKEIRNAVSVLDVLRKISNQVYDYNSKNNKKKIQINSVSISQYEDKITNTTRRSNGKEICIYMYYFDEKDWSEYSKNSSPEQRSKDFGLLMQCIFTLKNVYFQPQAKNLLQNSNIINLDSIPNIENYGNGIFISNDALINQFNSLTKESEKIGMIKETAKVSEALIQKARSNNNVKIDLTANNKADHYNGNNLLENFRLNIATVSDLKFQLETKGINISDIKNIENYESKRSFVYSSQQQTKSTTCTIS